MRQLRFIPGIAASAAILAAAACSSSTPAAAPAAAVPAPAPARHPRAVPSPSCTRTTTFDYIVRTTEPGLQPQADEIGNTDYADCESSLADFAATAGQADGECTTIALASGNPGYNVSATPAPPLKNVIQAAGPGC